MKGHIKALLLAAFLIAGGGFFLLGRSTAMSEYAKERDLDIRVNRSELEGLGTIEGPIYVTGHKSPDADTVGCSIGYAALLQKLGYDARPVGSAATIVWMRYRNYGLELDKKIAMVMMGSILSDTQNLKLANTTTADREALNALRTIAGVSDSDAFFQDMFKASLSYEGMTDEEIFLSDYKEYEVGGRHYAIGVVLAYDETVAKDLAERMKAVMPPALKKNGMDMGFTQITIFHDDLDMSYIIPSDDIAAEVLETGFGDRAVFDGTSYILPPGGARKKLMVPVITDVLEAHPQE